jgi:exodeoxyribonuclease V alpha subunit
MKLFSHFTILPRFVVIGDKNQLPPIECGNFFQEILKLEDSLLKDCIVHLNKVYRVLEVTGPNGEKSDGIIRNSMEIATGGSTIIPFPNFQIVKGTERTVLGIARSLKFNGISKMNFIVLSPYNKNLKMLNEGCQELYSEGSYTVDSLGRKWYIGDKVMMTVNNYKINVMNGEEGIVTNIYQDCLGIKFNTEEFIFSTKVKSENTMQFIGEEVSSTDETKLDVSTIIHSYAITIHKSQGSEWDYVIIYLGDDESIVRRNFLNKNLLYTSITRAKLCVWIVGNNSLVNKIAETTRCMEYDVLYDLLS